MLADAPGLSTAPAVGGDYDALAVAAGLRRESMAHRLVAILAVAVVLQLGFAWTWAWAWAGLYFASQLAELKLGRRMMADRRSQTVRRLYLSCLFLASALYSAVSVPLVLHGGSDSEVIAVILLAGGLVNSLIASRASRAAFLAVVAPYAAFLVSMPVLEFAAGVHEQGEWIVMFGAVVLVAHTYSAWTTHCRTVLAEEAVRAELESRRQEAERATEAKSSFVAMISHELRTPLSGVLAAGNQLRSQGDPSGREAVEVIVDAGRFMQTLLDDLLDLAKLEAGRMTVEAVDFDLGQLVWSVERHWAAAAREANKPLRLTSAFGLPANVSGDPTRLRQVVNNLLSNALKFTGPEGVSWTVDVCMGPDCRTLGGSGLRITVTDTGPGMTREQLDRLFTPFDQTAESVARTHGGTGLGLALSRELARRMGGDLSVESQPGRGSTFVLNLPLAPAAGQAASAQRQADTVAVAKPRLLRILVVDDHPINRRTLALVLQPAGAEVTTADSSQEALERLANETFDAVLTDLNMPDMDGVALARAIRAGPARHAAVPVIAVTGADSVQERAACLAAGMTGYVTKPIDVAALYSALEAAVSCPVRQPGEPRAA